MTCYQLIYTSRAVTDAITADVLLDILTKSNQKNRPLKISGLLACKDQQFIQLLEGDEDKVKDLFAIIKQDPRHTDIAVVYAAVSADRNMPTWAMGFTLDGLIASHFEKQPFFISLVDTMRVCKLMHPEIAHEFSKFFSS